MKRLISTLTLLTCILFLPSIKVYPNNILATDLSATLNQVRMLQSQFNFDLNSAFYSKLKKEDNKDKLLNQVKYQLVNIDNLSKGLREDIRNPELSEDFKQNAILVLLGLDYYTSAYQELQEYISDDNQKNNFDSLGRISTQSIAGFNTFNWVSQWIKG